LGGGESPRPAPPETKVGPAASTGAAALLTASASLVTSLVTLVGFLYTSLLTWRKERREAVLADLEVQKRSLENEKLRRELEQASSPDKPHLDL
jgi:hypothetical protein